MSLQPRRALILLIEDSDDDSFFFRRALRNSDVDCELVHLADGEAAIEHLRAVCEGQAPRPDVVFLDLKLPVVSGFDILSWARTNACNPPLDMVILSGSEQITDRNRARGLGALDYYTKPMSSSQLRLIMQSRDRASESAAELTHSR